MSVTLIEKKLVLGIELAGTLMTPEEFDAVEEYDDLYFYELINGVLVVTPLPLEAEADPNEELGRLLRNYQEDHPQGSALDKTLQERIVRTRTNRRRGDRVIWAGLGRVPNPRVDPPTIIVEFVSRARRDRRRDYVEKRREYLELGVAEYWIIDRFRRSMTVVQNLPSGAVERVVGENETYQSPLLPGFELPLARLLGLADQWQRSESQ
jgi:Uma2 family endonuclease